MKRLLLVDDDALVAKLYRERLSAHGFQVNTATTGAGAITILRGARPDLVVLDLMMPDLSGVDVLKFIRSEPRLAATPVVLLTNAYLNDLGRQAAAIGIEKALLKAECTPSTLMASIDEILEKKKPRSEPVTTQASTTAPSAPQAAESAKTEVPPAQPSEKVKPGPKAVTDLLAQAPTMCADLRKLFQAFARVPREGPEQKAGLQDLYRKVHFLAAAAGLTDNAQLTQTATVFEALLYVLMDDPGRISPSVVRTLANLVDFVELLFRRAGESQSSAPLSAQVLVVDDDPMSNRLVVSALRQAQLSPRSTEDPIVAWQWAHHEQFDVILLDVEMAGLNGFELCQRLRGLPGYEKTPVIFVTIHSEFDSRAKSSLSGGNDLITKPILPMELAAKVVMHLIKSQMAA